MLNMCGTAVLVDIQSIGICAKHKGLGSQGIEDRLCNVPGRPVGTVKGHLQSLEGVDAQGDEISDISVSSADVVYSAADPVLKGEWNLKLPVQVILHLLDGLFIHLLSLG